MYQLSNSHEHEAAVQRRIEKNENKAMASTAREEKDSTEFQSRKSAKYQEDVNELLNNAMVFREAYFEVTRSIPEFAPKGKGGFMQLKASSLAQLKKATKVISRAVADRRITLPLQHADTYHKFLHDPESFIERRAVAHAPQGEYQGQLDPIIGLFNVLFRQLMRGVQEETMNEMKRAHTRETNRYNNNRQTDEDTDQRDTSRQAAIDNEMSDASANDASKAAGTSFGEDLAAMDSTKEDCTEMQTDMESAYKSRATELEGINTAITEFTKTLNKNLKTMDKQVKINRKFMFLQTSESDDCKDGVCHVGSIVDVIKDFMRTKRDEIKLIEEKEENCRNTVHDKTKQMLESEGTRNTEEARHTNANALLSDLETAAGSATTTSQDVEDERDALKDDHDQFKDANDKYQSENKDAIEAVNGVISGLKGNVQGNSDLGGAVRVLETLKNNMVSDVVAETRLNDQRMDRLSRRLKRTNGRLDEAQRNSGELNDRVDAAEGKADEAEASETEAKSTYDTDRGDLVDSQTSAACPVFSTSGVCKDAASGKGAFIKASSNNKFYILKKNGRFAEFTALMAAAPETDPSSFSCDADTAFIKVDFADDDEFWKQYEAPKGKGFELHIASPKWQNEVNEKQGEIDDAESVLAAATGAANPFTEDELKAFKDEIWAKWKADGVDHFADEFKE